MMQFDEAFQELERIAKQRIEEMDARERYLESNRSRIRDSIQIHSIRVDQYRNESLVAVDSSCDVMIKDQFGKNLFCTVIQPVTYSPERSLLPLNEMIRYSNVVDRGSVELAYEYMDPARYLTAYALCLEILCAHNLAGSYRHTLMDGSIVTFISKVNQAYQFATKHRNEYTASFLNEYPVILGSLIELAEYYSAVFIPKTSNRDEFKEYYKLTDLDFSDIEILTRILNEGEYVVVPIKQYDYFLPEAQNVALKDFFNSVNARFKVIYFKSPAGRVHKIEVMSDSVHRVMESIAQTFVLDGENMLIYEADQLAKEKLRALQDYNPLKFLWGYRL